MNKECIFCKIAAGDIPSSTIYEDENFKAILDIAPAAKGHTIILPKKHMENVYHMDDETAAQIFPVCRKLASLIKEELGCDGINILQNNGEAAGQTVFHLHIHLIPRYKNDDVMMKWNSTSYNQNEIEELAEKLRRRLS